MYLSEGLVAVVFNILLNTLRFTLMAVLRHVRKESQSMLHALEQVIRLGAAVLLLVEPFGDTLIVLW